MLFTTWRQRWRDAGTLKALCVNAERLAQAAGQPLPGAEHFVLAALALPDGTACRVFERLGADPHAYAAAITQQHLGALSGVGVHLPAGALDGAGVPAVPPSHGPYQAQPSARALMAALTRQVMAPAQRADPAAALRGAHVLLAASLAPDSVAARALRALGLEADRLVEAAAAELAA